MKRTQIYLTQDIYGALTETAERESLTLSEIIREMLRNHIRELKARSKREKPFLLTELAVLDKQRKGPSHLSGGYKEILYRR